MATLIVQPCAITIVHLRRSVAEKRKARGGDSGLGGPQEPPEILLEKLGFPRKKQFQKVGGCPSGVLCLHACCVLVLFCCELAVKCVLATSRSLTTEM
jgi:hypothetical protein